MLNDWEEFSRALISGLRKTETNISISDIRGIENNNQVIIGILESLCGKMGLDFQIDWRNNPQEIIGSLSADNLHFFPSNNGTVVCFSYISPSNNQLGLKRISYSAVMNNNVLRPATLSFSFIDGSTHIYVYDDWTDKNHPQFIENGVYTEEELDSVGM